MSRTSIVLALTASIAVAAVPSSAAVLVDRGGHHGGHFAHGFGAFSPGREIVDHGFAGHDLGGRAFYNSHFGYGFGNPGPGWGLRGRD